MAYRDIKNSIDTAKREGKEEGLAEGMEKGLAEGMEKGLAEGMEKGMEKGMKKGMEKGELKAKRETVISLAEMGLSADMALNPMSGGSSPVITQMYTWMMTMVFISINAHHWLFSAFYNSFQAMPIGYGFGFSPEVVQQIIFIVGQIFVIALKIALPIFGVLFITDVLLGFTSKVMPQMNIFMVSISLKIYLGLLLSIIFVRPILEYLNVLVPQFMQTIMAVF